MKKIHWIASTEPTIEVACGTKDPMTQCTGNQDSVTCPTCLNFIALAYERQKALLVDPLAEFDRNKWPES